MQEQKCSVEVRACERHSKLHEQERSKKRTEYRLVGARASFAPGKQGTQWVAQQRTAITECVRHLLHEPVQRCVASNGCYVVRAAG